MFSESALQEEEKFFVLFVTVRSLIPGHMARDARGEEVLDYDLFSLPGGPTLFPIHYHHYPESFQRLARSWLCGRMGWATWRPGVCT